MQKNGNVWRNNQCTHNSPHICALPLRCNRSELGYNQQALYCYGKVYNLDPSMLNALWDRATLAKEIGELKTVRDLQVYPTCAKYKPEG